MKPKTDWRNLSNVRFIKGFMGFYESPEEILACAYNFYAAVVGCFDHIIARFFSGAIYIHTVLTGSEAAAVSAEFQQQQFLQTI